MDSEQIQYAGVGDVTSPVFTFSKQGFIGDVSMRTSGQDFSDDEIADIADELLAFAGTDSDKGWFGLRQSNASWFGHGMEGFVELLGTEYEDRPGDTSGTTHQRGMAVWVGPCDRASAMIVTGQSRPRDHFIELLTVGLITNGYPIRREFIDAIDALPVEFRNAHEWDCPTYSVGRFHREKIPVEGVEEEIPRREYDNHIDELVCQNPFYERPEDLTEMLDLANNQETPERICETLAKYERVRCHVKTSYAPNEDPDGYRVTRFEITDLRDMAQNSVSAVNTSIKVQPNL